MDRGVERIGQRIADWGQRIADLGLSAIKGISFIGQAARLIVQSFYLLIRGPAIGQPVRLRHVVQEIITGGIQSLPVVILMASTIGVMLSIQGIHSLRIFGAETQVSFGLALSIPREFAPLITGIIVAGRSGSQLASRVGSMRLNGEIDALTVMGISPVRFIVAPALFGLLISLPILVGVATVASLTAGQLYIEATIGIASQAFWADVLSVVTMVDLAHCFGKAVLFAFLISLIGIVMGLGVSGGAEVLGRATTSSVVTCIGAIIAADTAVALLL